MFKPYPINKLQDLRGGFGVMMDDIVAGIYAAILLSLALLFAAGRIG
ncbi:MAG TPA: phosphatidylglycerophosphatase A [Blastocatellia bacterium]|nr:phosphatidylglycerophosphatase A [Blastocatellia bacterium]